jgi:hypothetical protein
MWSNAIWTRLIMLLCIEFIYFSPIRPVHLAVLYLIYSCGTSQFEILAGDGWHGCPTIWRGCVRTAPPIHHPRHWLLIIRGGQKTSRLLFYLSAVRFLRCLEPYTPHPTSAYLFLHLILHYPTSSYLIVALRTASYLIIPIRIPNAN